MVLASSSHLLCIQAHQEAVTEQESVVVQLSSQQLVQHHSTPAHVW